MKTASYPQADSAPEEKIPGAISALDRQLSHLRDMVARLEDRLADVLVPYPDLVPYPEGSVPVLDSPHDDGPRVVEPPRSTLHQMVLDLDGLARWSIVRLDTIIERLEI